MAVRDHNVEFKSNLWICKSVRVCVCVCVKTVCVCLSVCLPHCLGLHYVCICTSLCIYAFFLLFLSFSFMIGRFTQQLDNLTGQLSCLLHPHRVYHLLILFQFQTLYPVSVSEVLSQLCTDLTIMVDWSLKPNFSPSLNQWSMHQRILCHPLDGCAAKACVRGHAKTLAGIRTKTNALHVQGPQGMKLDPNT